MPDSGNAAQISMIAEQVARAAIIQIRNEHPEFVQPKETDLHPIVKWVVGVVASLGTIAITGMAIWLVGSVSQMRETLARLDERMVSGSVKDSRFDDLDRRVQQNTAAIAELRK